MSPEEHKADRRLYRQMWYLSRKHAGTPRGDAALAWLEARAAALKAAHPPRQPYQKKVRSRRAAKLQTRRLTAEEKARLHELKRIRYSVDDDFREKVNAHNRAYYLRNRAKILAVHRAYNSRPDVLARRRELARRPEAAARRRQRTTTPEARARRNAKRVRKNNRAARRAEWAETPEPTKADLKKLPLAERIRIRQRWKYRKRVAASQP